MQNNAGGPGVNLNHLRDSIFRIPGLYKMRNEQAYQPYKFSIGPWHHGNELLGMGQRWKEFSFNGLINRFRDPVAKRDQLQAAITNVSANARVCYERGYLDVALVADADFERILLHDGCFIIELFCRDPEQAYAQENEFEHLRGMTHVIYHDLLLLDNQIPWFVLQLLFDRTNEYPQRNFTLVQSAMKFFRQHREPPGLEESPLHLVDFVWNLWDFSLERNENDPELGYETLIPSATRLKEAGVKFKKAESRNILDVKFNKEVGVLEIPPLLVTPSTETILRNLIIFEQCRRGRKPKVTSYAVLLDCLVDSSDDVHLMNRAKILDYTVNPEETANFLNRVRDNTYTREFLYATLRKDVNDYCERRWPRWRAALIHNYFTKPWAIVSVVFATIVLFFTIMQVFYK